MRSPLIRSPLTRSPLTRSIVISIEKQTLQLLDDGALLAEYAISTSLFGAGEENGSFKTPRGRHVVRAMLGGDKPLNAVFVSRRFTGEIYSPELSLRYPGRDWILTRIIWLSGCERGLNRLGRNDTMRRYIYIHGTPDAEPMGVPASHGCVRMRNADIVDLYGLISVGTQVVILER